MAMRFLLILAVLSVASPARAMAQCMFHPNDSTVGISLMPPPPTSRASPGTASASSLPINVVDCGARPNRTTDQTAAIQAAINASCSAIPNHGSPPPVYVPAGQYIIVNLHVDCSGLLLYGAGTGGLRGGLGGTRLCSSNSPAPMLTVGTPDAPVARVTLQDFQLS